jgi:hypothetical protein
MCELFLFSEGTRICIEVLENKELKRMFLPKKEQVTGQWGN